MRDLQPDRDAAMAFVNGANHGWLGSDLAAWCQRHLLATGFLVLQRPDLGAFVIEETGSGRITLPVAASSHPGRATTSNAMRVVAAAHDRVLSSLRGLVATPIDDRFVNGALYTGRVQRSRGRDANDWVPTLDEGGSLSQWVLALFAADVLRDRTPYESTFIVCDACGRVGFEARSRSRSRCAAHDGGAPSSRSTPRQITVPPPTARGASSPELEVNDEGDRITRPWAIRR